MKIIADISEELNVISESTGDGNRTWKVSGVFLQSNTKNRNGRIYPKHILEREVSRYTLDLIAKNRAMGELNHPEGPSINLDRVSHKITKLYADGDNFIGEAIILDTPMGKIAQGLLAGGIQLGTSSRGMGSLKECQGFKQVQEDFHLATAGDLVSDPSAHDAWLNSLYENVDYFWNADGTIKSQMVAEKTIEEIEASVKSRTLDADRKMQIFERYINSLLN